MVGLSNRGAVSVAGVVEDAGAQFSVMATPDTRMTKLKMLAIVLFDITTHKTSIT